jgi:glycerophosphoryl diester phosphodiesterase
VIYAHRGLHGPGTVENSATAFRAALEAGLGIECDVRQTADGAAVVFHDWELDRLTGETGPVIARTASELARLRLLATEDTIWPLPRLLAELAGQAPLLIELKSRRRVAYAPLCRAVLDALEGYSGPVAVMSFDPRISRWFARHAPATVRGLVVSEEGARTARGSLERHLALWRAQPDFLACDVRDLPSRFATVQRRRGVPVLTWTVRSPALLERALVHADGYIAEAEGVASALARS